jgi:tRNA (guanine37-N1)-methyltransferase
MKFTVLSLFPEMFISPFKEGVVGQALHHQQISLNVVNPRKFAKDNYNSVDDRPYGGGDGMVMMAEPLKEALLHVQPENCEDMAPVIYLSPQGKPLTQKKIEDLAKKPHLILLCGRYGGVDQRFIRNYVDEEISIGDYVISGGELAAMVLIDAISRQLPGVLGNSKSAEEESFNTQGLLEAPLFTRPQNFDQFEIPKVLLSGDHAKIETWRKQISILRTLERRPDLMANQPMDGRELTRTLDSLSDAEKDLLQIDAVKVRQLLELRGQK